MNKLASQMALSRQSGYSNCKFIIDLTTPDSSRCSSPVSEICDLGYSTGDEAESVEDAAPLPPPTPVQQMVSNLPVSGMSILINYLHDHASTIVDVEALVPAFLYNPAIMNKLAENIGYYSAYGFITSTELEQILVHVLAKGDVRNCFYELIKSQIAYFNQEASLRNPRRQGLEQNEHLVRTGDKKKKKPKRKAKQKTEAAPAPNQSAQARPEKEQKPAPVSAPDSDVSETKVNIQTGFFSRSRLHNGPGLYDKKRPIVRLPKHDTQEVWTQPGAKIMGGTLREEKELQWVKTKPESGFLFKDKKKARIVVKLPPSS